MQTVVDRPVALLPVMSPVLPINEQLPTLEADRPEPVGRFEGMWSSYDHTNRVLIGNRIELWATRTRCGMTCRPVLGDDPGERIEFDDRRIVWAFTCIMRLMLKQGTITCRAGDA
ncbi:MAG: hypothetical protein H0T72_01520 [Chloroflexia bacterium]|nr:hypothetical protein [Chloroflexia bacterium]